jgi:peroxiredoxin
MRAPEFTLPDQAQQPWTLSTHRGAGIVLVFYRGDW